jgi:hypothetical protein
LEYLGVIQWNVLTPTNGCHPEPDDGISTAGLTVGSGQDLTEGSAPSREILDRRPG